MGIIFEQLLILQARKEESMRLLLALKRPDTAKNITYLRKTAMRHNGELQVQVPQECQTSERTRNSIVQSRQNPTSAQLIFFIEPLDKYCVFDENRNYFNVKSNNKRNYLQFQLFVTAETDR